MDGKYKTNPRKGIQSTVYVTEEDLADPAKFFDTISNEDLGAILIQFYRLLKDNTHAYVMSDSVTLPYFYYFTGFRKPCDPCIYNDDGAYPFENLKPLIWDKKINGMGYHYRCRYEFVMMLDKGKNRRLNNLSIPDVLEFKAIMGNNKLCPTQKPEGLFSLLIEQSSNEGDLILDPFLGSGTSAVCAKRLNRRGVYIDISEANCEIAAKRLSQTILF